MVRPVLGARNAGAGRLDSRKQDSEAAWLCQENSSSGSSARLARVLFFVHFAENVGGNSEANTRGDARVMRKGRSSGVT